MSRGGANRQTDACPCGSALALDECCQPIIAGDRPAASAEALMRARYTAYTQGNVDYLLSSWAPASRPAELRLNDNQHWLGLKVLAARGGGPADTEGTVEFVARYKVAGRGYRLHEVSRFRQSASGWRYLDGERGATDSAIRADPGSGDNKSGRR